MTKWERRLTWVWVAFFVWVVWATGPMGGSNEFVRPSTSSAGARLHGQRAEDSYATV